MGAKCCMPVRDDVPMILRKEYRGANEHYSRRNNRCSPSWGFRCDNRTHIEDIEDNHAWALGEHGSTVVSEFKNGGDVEIEGHSDGSSSSGSFQTPNWQKFHNEMSVPGNSQSSPADFSTVSNSSWEETEITELPSSNPSTSRVCSKPPDSLRELSFCTDELSTGEAYARSSSDRWSMRSLSELIVPPQICGLCSNNLMDKSPCENEPATIIAVLVCGHVYHADCLENITPEASKFDPSCPTCSHGESSKGKAPVKARSNAKDTIFRREKSGNYVNGKGSFGRAFLRRHFSVGSRSVKLASEREMLEEEGVMG